MGTRTSTTSALAPSRRRRRWALALAGLLACCAAATAATADATTATASAQVAPDALDGFSRAAVRSAWTGTADPALAVPTAWTGLVADCRAGAPSAAAQQSALDMVNLYRDLTDLSHVRFDTALSAQAQRAALIMDAQGALSHNPPDTWACWTAEGVSAAGRSNLYLGPTSGARAVLGYIDDPGASNTSVGHRRWILDPGQEVMGHGQTGRANALYVVAPQAVDPSAPEWIPWPSAGYLPVQAEPEGR